MGEPEIDLKLTVPQAKTLRACIDFVAANTNLGKWPHWRLAAQADTKLFEGIEGLKASPQPPSSDEGGR